jgi:serine/threonine protein kinase
MTVQDMIRLPVARYRMWRAQRWFLSYLKRGATFHRDIRPDNILINDGAVVVDAWPASAPRFIKKEQNTWIVLALGLLTLCLIWARKQRDAERARMIAHKACAIFDVFERLLPRRVIIEEFGDAREDIERLARAGQGRRIRLRVMSTLWRGFWNSMDYWLS